MLIHAMAFAEAFFCYNAFKDITGCSYIKLRLTSGYCNEPNRFVHISKMENLTTIDSLSEEVEKTFRKLEGIIEIENDNLQQSETNAYGSIYPINYVRLLRELGDKIEYNGKRLKDHKKYHQHMKKAKLVRKEVRKQAFKKIVERLEEKNESKEKGETQQSGKSSPSQQSSAASGK